jgi:hypothetical protein
MPKVTILIDKEGKVTIENTEIEGEACTVIGDMIANAVGSKQNQDLKQEYYQVPLPDYEHVNES